ncbi:MAG: cysteine--tRNA ligase [Prevotella sp.]|nr:cysteine--tRNA ligase [Prevotella sp.]
MESRLVIYNTLTRQKELFKPLHAPNVGMYVCGPTVYGDPHLGHARPAITFDLVFRYLKHLGYKVRYVRNITDVGHLEHDADEGEDKIAKKARLEQLEPMEIAQYYTNRYHQAMDALGCLRPSIEPHATGHILEQRELVQQILDRGFAYESNGSIYFDIEAYNKQYKYGILSGRSLENVKDASRDNLDGVGEKKSQADFALWKQAQPEHIMRWHVDFDIPEDGHHHELESDGFPGWHCECTAMGRKYLGDEFDIHGGGMDLVFPHHECEIAQAVASMGHPMVHYWMHNNMITINGQKMGKSLGNFITLEQFFTGQHPLLSKAYSPMTIRFFILSAHYRGTVDFSDEALQAAEKGLEKLMDAMAALERLQSGQPSQCDGSQQCDAETERIVRGLRQRCYDAMNDDLATPQLISHLFEACSVINKLQDHKATICADCLRELGEVMHLFVEDLLGLQPQQRSASNAEREEAFGHVVDMVLDLRAKAKAAKDWATSDLIRDQLAAAGFEVKDTKDGATWKLNR